MCLLSSFSPEPVAQNECWLSAKPEGASGSQCPLYPAPGYLGADTATATTGGRSGRGAAAWLLLLPNLLLWSKGRAAA